MDIDYRAMSKTGYSAVMPIILPLRSRQSPMGDRDRVMRQYNLGKWPNIGEMC